jgi:SAM-dependent methyltransferase
MSRAGVPESRHWLTVDRNPVSAAAQRHVLEALRQRYKGPVHDLVGLWDQQISGRSLLDIGVVEHTLDFAAKPNWKHALLRKRARRALGIDVLEAEVADLARRGFDVRLCDATSNADLGERFDVVYIGDVIEHVDKPVALLEFAARHVTDDGSILVTTPCPFWWRNILSMIKDGTYIGNVDHIRWVCPVHALELAHRSGLALHAYYTLETEGHSQLRRQLLKLINAAFGKAELFAWAYLYHFRRIAR